MRALSVVTRAAGAAALMAQFALTAAADDTVTPGELVVDRHFNPPVPVGMVARNGPCVSSRAGSRPVGAGWAGWISGGGSVEVAIGVGIFPFMLEMPVRTGGRLPYAKTRPSRHGGPGGGESGEQIRSTGGCG